MTPPDRDRADRMLVTLGYFPSRARARAAIDAGLVQADGETVSRPSQTLASTADIKAEAPHPYVSRGGVKLEAALDAFSIPVDGRTCLDVGASTGGFTDVLLRRNAKKVFAVDVGRDQFHPSLRSDPRTIVIEGQDARDLTRTQIPDAPDLVVCDASFIGLEKVLPKPLTLAAGTADLIALFKPQFQVGRAAIGKGGIVADRDATQLALEGTLSWLKEAGWPVEMVLNSPILGGDGNAEHLIWARRA